MQGAHEIADRLAKLEALFARGATDGERVLLELGRAEDAYHRYAPPMATGATYLTTWRALTRRYPDRAQHEALADLIAAHGEKGEWFAVAKTAGRLDIALDCAGAHDADPRTLIRAARDFGEKEPRFAATVALRAIAQLLAGADIRPGQPTRRTPSAISGKLQNVWAARHVPSRPWSGCWRTAARPTRPCSRHFGARWTSTARTAHLLD